MPFEPGDLVCVHWRRNRFQDLRESKLSPRGTGSFKVLHKLAARTTRKRLQVPFDPGDFGLEHWKKEHEDSRTNPFQEGEIDEGSSELALSGVEIDDESSSRGHDGVSGPDAHALVSHALGYDAEHCCTAMGNVMGRAQPWGEHTPRIPAPWREHGHGCTFTPCSRLYTGAMGRARPGCTFTPCSRSSLAIDVQALQDPALVTCVTLSNLAFLKAEFYLYLC